MNRVEIEDLLSFTAPSNPQYSPDGKYIAFETAKAQGKGYFHAVWLVRDGKAVQMTYSEDTSLIGWKDEHTLALRRNNKEHRPGTVDVWYLDVNGAEAQPAGTLPLDLRGFVKAGEGYVALGGIDRRDPDAYLDDEETYQKKAACLEEEKDYEVLDELPYWFNGRNFTDGKRTALFTVNGTDIKRVTEPEQNVGAFCVSGDTVYFTAETWKGVAKQKQQLYAYCLCDGTVKAVYDKDDMSFSAPFAMNGNAYIFASNHIPYGTNQTPDLYRIDEDGLKMVLKAELSLRNTIGSDTVMGAGHGAVVDGSTYVTLVTDDDHTAIRRYDSEFGFTTVWDEMGAVSCLDAKNGRIVFVHEAEDRLFEVYEADENGNVTRLTSLNEEALADKYIAKPERIDYVSGDLQLHGWVLRPMNYEEGKTYPAVLDIHGGPRVAYGTNFFHEMQVWASQGYFVFFTNIKGSDGRGDDFANLLDQYGFVDYDNLMDFTDAVLAAYPAIDQKRVCVTGGSYGGFMTNWIIGHTNRFCCAASQRSIANWISKCLISDIGYNYNVEQQGAKDIFTGTEALWRHSPLAYAANAVTPTLFIHSDEDRRCPLPEGMQMMQALMIKGVETKMCLFHGENHELSRSGKPPHRIRRLKEMTDWFNDHTGNN